MKKSKHYQLRWNVFDAVKIVEQHQELTYPVLRKIYSGDMLDAIYFGKIKNYQRYGVTFYSEMELEDGSVGIVERGMRMPEPMSLLEFIDGKDGWVGAKNYWLDMMETEFKDAVCHDAWAVANCMVRK